MTIARKRIAQIIAAVILLSALGRIAQCQTVLSARQAQNALSLLNERWTWELYWKRGIGLLNYRQGVRSSIELFVSTHAIGYCSVALTACAVYERSADGLGTMIAFHRAFTSDSDPKSVILTLLTPRAEIISAGREDLDNEHGKFRSGSNRIIVPRPGSSAVATPGGAVLEARATAFVTPKAIVPRAIRLRIRPKGYTLFRKKLREHLIESARSGSRYLVPFYSVRDPGVYVLVNNSDNSREILLFVFGPTNSVPQIGGHLDTDHQRTAVLAPLIESSIMDVIK